MESKPVTVNPKEEKDIPYHANRQHLSLASEDKTFSSRMLTKDDKNNVLGESGNFFRRTDGGFVAAKNIEGEDTKAERFPVTVEPADQERIGRRKRKEDIVLDTENDFIESESTRLCEIDGEIEDEDKLQFIPDLEDEVANVQNGKYIASLNTDLKFSKIRLPTLEEMNKSTRHIIRSYHDGIDLSFLTKRIVPYDLVIEKEEALLVSDYDSLLQKVTQDLHVEYNNENKDINCDTNNDHNPIIKNETSHHRVRSTANKVSVLRKTGKKDTSSKMTNSPANGNGAEVWSMERDMDDNAARKLDRMMGFTAK